VSIEVGLGDALGREPRVITADDSELDEVTRVLRDGTPDLSVAVLQVRPGAIARLLRDRPARRSPTCSSPGWARPAPTSSSSSPASPARRRFHCSPRSVRSR
jgi:hypothetical protein